VPIGKEGLVAVPPALEGGVEVMLAVGLPILLSEKHGPFSDRTISKLGGSLGRHPPRRPQGLAVLSRAKPSLHSIAAVLRERWALKV
jgi:hypothetical protein